MTIANFQSSIYNFQLPIVLVAFGKKVSGNAHKNEDICACCRPDAAAIEPCGLVQSTAQNSR